MPSAGVRGCPVGQVPGSVPGAQTAESTAPGGCEGISTVVGRDVVRSPVWSDGWACSMLIQPSTAQKDVGERDGGVDHQSLEAWRVIVSVHAEVIV